jgi:hypothetical protein
MELFIAICRDRHIDEIVRVFSTQEAAIMYCKEFASDEELEERELTQSMVRDGWIYYAAYGAEGDSVRVKKGTLDPQE